MQTRIAGAGVKTPGTIRRRLLPGKVAFFLKGKNKTAFGVLRYRCNIQCLEEVRSYPYLAVVKC